VKFDRSGGVPIPSLRVRIVWNAFPEPERHRIGTTVAEAFPLRFERPLDPRCRRPRPSGGRSASTSRSSRNGAGSIPSRTRGSTPFPGKRTHPTAPGISDTRMYKREFPRKVKEIL